jgi:phage shock protein E
MLQALFGKKEVIDYKELVKQGAVVVDVRSKEEFDGGHIDGAVNVPFDGIVSGLQKLGSKETVIITCCVSGGRSSLAKNMLHAAGYDTVYNGGGWQALQNNLR